jgi:hypothetical protein
MTTADPVEVAQALVAFAGLLFNSWVYVSAMRDLKVAMRDRDEHTQFVAFRNLRLAVLCVLMQVAVTVVGVISVFIGPPYHGEQITDQAVVRNAGLMVVTFLSSLQGYLNWKDQRDEDSRDWPREDH